MIETLRQFYAHLTTGDLVSLVIALVVMCLCIALLWLMTKWPEEFEHFMKWKSDI